MSLAESQRILTSPFQDYKAIPPEPRSLSPADLMVASGLLGLTLVCLSKATCFTPKTKTNKTLVQRPGLAVLPQSIVKERPPPPAVQTEVGVLSLPIDLCHTA